MPGIFLFATVMHIISLPFAGYEGPGKVLMVADASGGAGLAVAAGATALGG